MKLLDRYVLREFLGYLMLGLVGFIVIFVVVDIFEKIDVFLDHRASPLLIASFYLYRAPEVVVQVMPVALLLATFLALGQLNKFNELTAMRSAGISLVRILIPVLGMAALAALAALALSELVVPLANRERDDIYEQQIQSIQPETVAERPDFTYIGSAGRIYYMRLYSVKERRMHQVSIQEFRRDTLRRRIDADEARWDGKRWVFENGIERRFTGDRETATAFRQGALPGLRERPEDFAKETRTPAEMNYFELRTFVDRLRASGGAVTKYLVDLHLKLAFPLVNFIVVMIGASLATQLRLRSAAIGFGLSVAISFIYYAMMRTGQALGHTGALPPYAAAWLGDMAFGLVAILMLWRAQRT